MSRVSEKFTKRRPTDEECTEGRRITRRIAKREAEKEFDKVCGLRRTMKRIHWLSIEGGAACV